MDAIRNRVEEEGRKNGQQQQQEEMQKIDEIASAIEPEVIQKFRDGMDHRDRGCTPLPSHTQNLSESVCHLSVSGSHIVS
jgi:predicted  nucleic acid-binding Zn-ribbon protein